jgi:hypothetical protein
MYIFCTICQDLLTFERGPAVALNCGHSYHNVCIQNWMKLNRSCPICKAIVNRKKLQRLYFSYRQTDNDQGTGEIRDKMRELNNDIEQNM